MAEPRSPPGSSPTKPSGAGQTIGTTETTQTTEPVQTPPPAAAAPSLLAAAPVEPDPEAVEGENEADSALGSSASILSTESLTPSILEYRQLHGRTYANAQTGEYWGPNDEKQSEGLDLIHNALGMLMEDKLHLAPINPEGRVLDVGTGTGIWAMDFADEYPSAEVFGTDLSPIQPSWVPPNLIFEIDDCLLDWTWPEDHFDFIHMRALYGCIPDWTELHRKALRHLKPGGYLEHVEIGCQGLSDHVQLPDDHAFHTWAQSFYAAGEKMERPFTICLPGKSKEHMEEAGFVDIVETRLKLPVNGWPKDTRLKQAGMLFQHALDRDMEGFSMFALTQLLGWTREEVLLLVAQMRKAIRDKSICPYIDV